jgi:ABC-type xylose transport system substrate-binding protein
MKCVSPAMRSSGTAGPNMHNRVIFTMNDKTQMRYTKTQGVFVEKNSKLGDTLDLTEQDYCLYS